MDNKGFEKWISVRPPEYERMTWLTPETYEYHDVYKWDDTFWAFDMAGKRYHLGEATGMIGYAGVNFNEAPNSWCSFPICATLDQTPRTVRFRKPKKV